MAVKLGRVVLLVRDYDEAFHFYENNFGAIKLFDQTNHSGQRFLHIGFGNEENAGIWFIKAGTVEREKIGNQVAPHPALVFYTDEFENLYQRLQKNKIRITREPQTAESYRFFHCRDLYGNEIIVVEITG